MKTLQQIIQRVAENPAQPWALATLVQTEGSTYRKNPALDSSSIRTVIL
jgi:hypothetical protein